MLKTLSLIAAALLISACVIQDDSRNQVLASSQSQVALRSIQTRAFDTGDKQTTLRTVIATLQDLGFVIRQADDVLGSVSASKLDRYDLRMTVTVRPRSPTQLLVRANAQYNDMAVEDPLPYQQFFAALERSMFLTAQQVD
jgi:hypothetical protein